MNVAIGHDYRMVVHGYFCGQTATRELHNEVRSWCREVRSNSLDILEELATLCHGAQAEQEHRLDAIVARELQQRTELERQGAKLAQRIEAFASRSESSKLPRRTTLKPLVRNAIAVALATLPAACTSHMSETAPMPLDAGIDNRPHPIKDAATDAQQEPDAD